MNSRRTIITAMVMVFALISLVACSQDERGQPDRGQPVDNLPLAPAPVNASLVVAPDGDDGAAGTADAPLRTIAAAAQRAQPGMTILIRNGTYEGDIKTEAQGTASARIAYVAESPAVKIVGSGTQDGVWENNGDYVDIVGFDVSGRNDVGIYDRGSFVRIIQNRVYGMPRGNCIYTANDNYDLTDIDVIGNVTHGCGATKLDHGIYVSHRRGVIANNISYGNPGFGIHCWHACNEVLIANNLVFGNAQGGIVIGGANDAGVPVDNSLVANNIVVDNGREGIREGGDSGSDNRFVNNLLWGNESDRILISTGEEQGTMVADPQFVNFRIDGLGDYRLLPSSPAVDTGLSSLAPPVTIDLDRVPRPQSHGFDLGPYEQ